MRQPTLVLAAALALSLTGTAFAQNAAGNVAAGTANGPAVTTAPGVQRPAAGEATGTVNTGPQSQGTGVGASSNTGVGLGNQGANQGAK